MFDRNPETDPDQIFDVIMDDIPRKIGGPSSVAVLGVRPPPDAELAKWATVLALLVTLPVREATGR